MNIIILGAPGAGKGTQAELISKKYNIPQISTGNIIREQVKNNTEIGRKVRGVMECGKLVPDEMIIRLVKERIKQKDCEKGLIFDGFPRTIKQAELMPVKIDYVINIDVSDNEIIKRAGGRRTCLNCGATYNIYTNPPRKESACDKCNSEIVQRDDDEEETVKNRLKIYRKQTLPLLKYYKNGIININGEKPIQKILQDILTRIR